MGAKGRGWVDVQSVEFNAVPGVPIDDSTRVVLGSSYNFGKETHEADNKGQLSV